VADDRRESLADDSLVDVDVVRLDRGTDTLFVTLLGGLGVVNVHVDLLADEARPQKLLGLSLVGGFGGLLLAGLADGRQEQFVLDVVVRDGDRLAVEDLDDLSDKLGSAGGDSATAARTAVRLWLVVLPDAHLALLGGLFGLALQ